MTVPASSGCSTRVVQGYQVAIVSRGEGCTYTHKPEMFTKVAKDKEFIRNITENFQACGEGPKHLSRDLP